MPVDPGRPRGDRLRRRARGCDPPPGAVRPREPEPMIEYGASPRGPIGLIQAGRALALLRGRSHVSSDDVRDLAADVLRHRLVLSYEASPRTSPPMTSSSRCWSRSKSRRPTTSEGPRSRERTPPPEVPPARQGPGPMPQRSSTRSTWLSRTNGGRPAGRSPRRRRRRGTSSPSCGPTSPATTRATSTRRQLRARSQPHVRLHVPERTLTTWIVLDISPSMAFGTAAAAEVRRRRRRDARDGAPRRAPRRSGRPDDLRSGERPRLAATTRIQAGRHRVRRALEEGLAPDGVRVPRRSRKRSSSFARSRASRASS